MFNDADEISRERHTEIDLLHAQRFFNVFEYTLVIRAEGNDLGMFLAHRERKPQGTPLVIQVEPQDQKV
jgi:hypothetical protein